MTDSRCHVLKNSSHNDDIPPLRIALYDNCKLTSIDLLNSLTDSLKMPYILTFHPTSKKVYNNGWTGILGDIVDNNSDIGASLYVSTYQRLEVVDFSPMLGYGNGFSILSGKIFGNTGNQFNVFNGYSTDVWTVIGITLIIVAIFENIFYTMKINIHC